MFLVFHLKSTGDITFSENKSYWIDNIGESIPFAWGYGKSGNCRYLDERTLIIEIGYSFDGNSVVGRSIEMSFEDIIEYDTYTEQFIIPNGYQIDTKVISWKYYKN